MSLSYSQEGLPQLSAAPPDHQGIPRRKQTNLYGLPCSKVRIARNEAILVYSKGIYCLVDYLTPGVTSTGRPKKGVGGVAHVPRHGRVN